MDATPDTLYSHIQAALVILNDLPSGPPSPSVQHRNRESLDTLQAKMTAKGLIKPLSMRERLASLSSHLAQAPSSPASQSDDPALEESVSSVMDALRRVTHKRTATDPSLGNVSPTGREAPSVPSSSQRENGQAARENQMQLHPAKRARKGKRRQVDTEDEEEEEEEEGATGRAGSVTNAMPPAKGSKKVKYAPEHAQALLDQVGHVEALAVADVLALFQKANPLALPEAEMQALARAFGGVQWATETAWTEAFKHLTVQEAEQFHARVAASHDLAGIVDVESRLVQGNLVSRARLTADHAERWVRLQLINRSEKQLLGHQVVHNILNKIDAIHFANDYSELSISDKTRWLKGRYFEESAEHDATQPFDVNDAKLDADQPVFKKWKREFGYKTTARNRLFNLFVLVSHAPFVVGSS
ncbi:hypothetical protein HWV62_35949 [Athelia sp. TMB]|nr:hypothetical protein HWV62_35949 [Athelia sp. TMB]